MLNSAIVLIFTKKFEIKTTALYNKTINNGVFILDSESNYSNYIYNTKRKKTDANSDLFDLCGEDFRKSNWPTHKKIDLVKTILGRGADINSKNSNGLTPLLLSMNYDIKLAPYLILLGADVNAQAKNGLNSLMVACRRTNFTMVKKLVHAKANLNLVDKNGRNALCHLSDVPSGSVDIALFLIDKGIELNPETLSSSKTHYCSSVAKVVEAYMEKRAIVEQNKNSQETHVSKPHKTL